jgi:CAAX protease family protein
MDDIGKGPGKLGPSYFAMAAMTPPKPATIGAGFRVQSRIALPIVAIGALIAIEIGILLATYSFGFDCIDFVPRALCYGLSLAEIRAVTFIGALLLLLLAQPALRRLIFTNENLSRRRRWLKLQVAGFAVLMVPWVLAVGGWTNAYLSVLCWFSGGVLAATSTAFYVASPARWRIAVSGLGPPAMVVLALGALAPEIARFTQEAWLFQPLTRATFHAAVRLVDALGVPSTFDSSHYTLSSGAFQISVAPVCSGLEGFGLILAFLGCYFLAFGESLRFPNVWVLLPIGLALSWMLNVVRIATLFVLGSHGHADLAVKGFHSHAGWLMFSILAFAIIGASRTVPWFQKQDTVVRGAAPLTADWTAARIIPFAAFMAASLLLSTFTLVPDLWYGVKVVAMGCALAAFLPLYRSRLTRQLDLLSIVLGVSVGVLWIAFGRSHVADGAALDTAVGALPATLLVVWIVLRLAGTLLLVPCVEELFFRGYLLDRFSHSGLQWKLFGFLLSTALFAVMHDRWMLAGLAGAVYGALYLRSGRLADAIAAHASSNAVIGLYALATSQWSVI